MTVFRAPYRIDGGVHPEYGKQATRDAAIRVMPLPERLRVSMAQHLGKPAMPTVKKGDQVKRGQLIGEAAGFVSAAVHAPTSGTVKAVGPAATAGGQTAVAVEIEPDGEDSWDSPLNPHRDWSGLGPREIVEIVADAGIAGMGGAGFPTHVKLSPPPGKTIDTLIVNGAECEPYLSADDRLMREEADRVWGGARIIGHAVGASAVRVTVESNKPEAITALEKAMQGSDGYAGLVVLKTEYPQGAEKQQIKAVTGREVPPGGLPMDVGALVENVGTCAAVWDAVVRGLPLTERVTTVTGQPVSEPGNILARLGVSYADLVNFCGGTVSVPAKVISGGPMMGLAQPSLDVPTTKTTSGLLLLSRQQVVEFSSMPCISCGRCVAACPMRLVPSELSQMIEAEDYEAAETLNVIDCIECGCCAYECPARRPLVQQMRRGKAQVMLKKRQAQS